MPSIENKVQTAKLTAKATVLADSTDHCFCLRENIKSSLSKRLY
jgi:hypothetical protein